MVTRREFLRIGAGSLTASWFMRTACASSLKGGAISSPNIAVLVAGNAGGGIQYETYFKPGLIHALTSISPEPVFFPSLQEMGSGKPWDGMNSQHDETAHVIIGLVPVSQWRHALIELTKQNMSVILHGQHRYGVRGESLHEHQIVTSVCDSLNAQLLSGSFVKNAVADNQWTVRVMSPTSEKRLSTVYGDNISNKFMMSEVSPPRHAYSYGNAPDAATHERYICSWSDPNTISRHGIRTLVESSIKQSDSNRLYALQTNDLADMDSVAGTGQFSWLASLGFALGVESLRAIKKESLRKVAALPWAPGVSDTLVSSNMRTDIFCGGCGNHDKPTFNIGRLDLCSFIAIKHEEQGGSLV